MSEHIQVILANALFILVGTVILWFKQRKTRLLVDEELQSLRELAKAIVPRPEHDVRWAEIDKTLCAQREQIDKLEKLMTSEAKTLK